MFKIRDGREHFYQWDIDRQLVLNDELPEVHFCNRTGDCSLVCETFIEDGVTVVNVPNILLQTDWKIKVYAYDANYTKYEQCFDVVKRTKPADYVYTETEVKTYKSIEDKLNTLTSVIWIGEGVNSITEGYNNIVTGEMSHAEGARNNVSGAMAHAEGMDNVVSGSYAHAGGNTSSATASSSFAQGQKCIASGKYSHAEGLEAKAEGEASHAEGAYTIASGSYSHAQGHSSKATGNFSNAMGQSCTASGSGSSAQGYMAVASGKQSTAHGYMVNANGEMQSVRGKLNIIDNSNKYIDIVGNGTNSGRSNAYTLDWSGNAWYKGTIEATGIILKSPSGKRFKVTVNDDGTLATTAV
jgi:hypothetical protein